MAASADEKELAVSQGYEAFKDGDWVSALFFLRKAVSLGDVPEAAWYLLVLSELYSQEFEAAAQDCRRYIDLYPSGDFRSLIDYQYGRALFLAGKYQDSLVQFTDFCQAYPDSQFYPSALFFMGESFFGDRDYSAAKVVYTRLVEGYPDSERVPEALARLETIDQVEREEKLLYLLKVTGEEYLAAKEDYEKQLRRYQSEGAMGLQDQLSKSFSDMQQLQGVLEELRYKNEEQSRRIAELESENEELAAAALAAPNAEPVLPEPTPSGEGEEASPQEALDEDVASLVDEILSSQPEKEGDSGKEEKDMYSLEELVRKAHELQRLLEEKSNGGDK